MYADIIFYNGKLCTLDSDYAGATALAVSGSQISAVGSDDEILKLANKDTRLFNLNGKMLLPGFVDSHMHFLQYALSADKVDLSPARSLSELQSLLSEKLNQGIPEGEWLQGMKFNNQQWDLKELPTRKELDAISTEVPIIIRRVCYHISVCNTKALELMGLMPISSAESKKFFSSSVDIMSDGTPSGILREDAQNLAANAMPPLTKKKLKEVILSAAQDLLAEGITEIHTDDFDTILGDNGDMIMSAYRELAAENKLPVRVYQQCLLRDQISLERFLADGHRTGDCYGNYRIGPFKVLGDGSLGAHTAFLKKPYLCDSKTCGILNHSNEELRTLLSTAHNAGMQIAVHCIGDGCMQQILDIMEELYSDGSGKECRDGIVHCQIMSKTQQKEMKDLELLAYIQPIFIESDMDIVEKCIEHELASSSYAWKPLSELGVHLIGSSDCPVESFRILDNIQYAVTRAKLSDDKSWFPENALTLEESIRLFTLEGAYASFSENRRGSLTPGKDADLLVLDQDLYEVPSAEIHLTKVLLTMVAGKIAFQR